MASPLIKRLCTLKSPKRLTPKGLFKNEINSRVRPGGSSQWLSPFSHTLRPPLVPKLINSPILGKCLSPRKHTPIKKLDWGAEIILPQKSNFNQHEQNQYSFQEQKRENDNFLTLIDTPRKKSLLLYGLNMNKCWKRLGKGSFGTVIQAKYKGEDVAVKVIPKHRFKNKSLNSLKNEANALKLSHKNIVKTLQVIASEGEYGLLFMEVCNGVNLESLISTSSFVITSSQRARYVIDTASALQHCHKNGILHLDVKPSNIILCFPGEYCKLCDFGSSYNLNSIQSVTSNSSLNTVIYTDPQILQGKLPSEKSDVYSLGITSWQLMSCEVPYKGYSIHEIIYKVVSENFRPRMLQSIREEDEIYVEIYKRCWHQNSECRPSLCNVIKELGKVFVTTNV